MAESDATSDALQTAEALYNDVSQLAKTDPKNKRLLETQVHGATHLISLYARSRQFNRAESLFSEITEILIKNPEPRFREAKAGVAVSLSAAYGNAGFVERVRGIYNEVKAMAEQFPDEAELREYQSNIATNMAIDYINASQMGEVTTIYDEISELGERYPEQRGIQRDRGRILTVRIFHLTEETDDLKSARELYRQLADLAAAYPDEPYLRRAQADAAVSIIAKIDELEENQEE